VLGVAIGLPAGVGVLQYLLTALASEHEMKLTLGPLTYLVSISLTFGVSLIVGWMIARKKAEDWRPLAEGWIAQDREFSKVNDDDGLDDFGRPIRKEFQ
jgi:hypothetical protein